MIKNTIKTREALKINRHLLVILLSFVQNSRGRGFWFKSYNWPQQAYWIYKHEDIKKGNTAINKRNILNSSHIEKRFWKRASNLGVAGIWGTRAVRAHIFPPLFIDVASKNESPFVRWQSYTIIISLKRDENKHDLLFCYFISYLSVIYQNINHSFIANGELGCVRFYILCTFYSLPWPPNRSLYLEALFWKHFR